MKVIMCLVAVFVLINICWFVWREVKYGDYKDGMEKNDIPTCLVPRYKLHDAEGYDYGLKYPDYLSFTGNLSVGLPATADNPFTDFLIIWPKPLGGYKYGASVTVDGVNYQIYINEDGSAVDSQYSEIAARCKDTIDLLMLKADEKWNLK